MILPDKINSILLDNAIPVRLRNVISIDQSEIDLNEGKSVFLKGVKIDLKHFQEASANAHFQKDSAPEEGNARNAGDGPSGIVNKIVDGLSIVIEDFTLSYMMGKKSEISLVLEKLTVSISEDSWSLVEVEGLRLVLSRKEKPETFLALDCIVAFQKTGQKVEILFEASKMDFIVSEISLKVIRKALKVFGSSEPDKGRGEPADDKDGLISLYMDIKATVSAEVLIGGRNIFSLSKQFLRISTNLGDASEVQSLLELTVGETKTLTLMRNKENMVIRLAADEISWTLSDASYYGLVKILRIFLKDFPYRKTKKAGSDESEKGDYGIVLDGPLKVSLTLGPALRIDVSIDEFSLPKILRIGSISVRVFPTRGGHEMLNGTNIQISEHSEITVESVTANLNGLEELVKLLTQFDDATGFKAARARSRSSQESESEEQDGEQHPSSPTIIRFQKAIFDLCTDDGHSMRLDLDRACTRFSSQEFVLNIGQIDFTDTCKSISNYEEFKGKMHKYTVLASNPPDVSGRNSAEFSLGFDRGNGIRVKLDLVGLVYVYSYKMNAIDTFTTSFKGNVSNVIKFFSSSDESQEEESSGHSKIELIDISIRKTCVITYPNAYPLTTATIIPAIKIVSEGKSVKRGGIYRIVTNFTMDGLKTYSSSIPHRFTRELQLNMLRLGTLADEYETVLIEVGRLPLEFATNIFSDDGPRSRDTPLNSVTLRGTSIEISVSLAEMIDLINYVNRVLNDLELPDELIERVDKTFRPSLCVHDDDASDGSLKLRVDKDPLVVESVDRFRFSPVVVRKRAISSRLPLYKYADYLDHRHIRYNVDLSNKFQIIVSSGTRVVLDLKVDPEEFIRTHIEFEDSSFLILNESGSQVKDENIFSCEVQVKAFLVEHHTGDMYADILLVEQSNKADESNVLFVAFEFAKNYKIAQAQFQNEIRRIDVWVDRIHVYIDYRIKTFINKFVEALWDIERNTVREIEELDLIPTYIKRFDLSRISMNINLNISNPLIDFPVKNVSLKLPRVSLRGIGDFEILSQDLYVMYRKSILTQLPVFFANLPVVSTLRNLVKSILLPVLVALDYNESGLGLRKGLFQGSKKSFKLFMGELLSSNQKIVINLTTRVKDEKAVEKILRQENGRVDTLDRVYEQLKEDIKEILSEEKFKNLSIMRMGKQIILTPLDIAGTSVLEFNLYLRNAVDSGWKDQFDKTRYKKKF